MIGDYKIIGVCITKLHHEAKSNYIQALNDNAMKQGYRVIVFNSFLDFFRGDSYDRGAKSIYDIINYDMLDALVIGDDCFYDKMLVLEMISKAEEKNIPVITLHNYYEGCYSIEKDFSDCLRELICHVLDQHNPQSVYFLAGFNGEENSEARLEIFKDEMKKHNRPYDDSVIFYGDFWQMPTYNVVDSWVEKDIVPDAVICANDVSAMAVCERLGYHGYKVPDDVLVTGFDGLESLEFRRPKLTTCCYDVKKTADKTLEIINKALGGETVPSRSFIKYDFVKGNSCGCEFENNIDLFAVAEELYKVISELSNNESKVYSHSDRLASTTNWNAIQHHLSKFILNDSDVILNSNFLSLGRRAKFIGNGSSISDKVVLFASNRNEGTSCKHTEFMSSELYPNFSEIISKKKLFIFQSIYVEDEVCGYYMAQISSIRKESQMVRRTLRTANIDFAIILNRIRQEYLSTRFESLKTRDSLTGLINLKGLHQQFENSYDEYRKKAVAVSIYAIPQYKYIMDNYGLGDAENAVSMTAEALQYANSKSAIIARITEEEFIVINLDNDPVLVGNEITRAVASFFKIIEDYNSSCEKNYYIEVNCGCVVSNPGWENDLTSFIKAAKGEMYLNKLKYRNSAVEKEVVTQSDYELYQKFDLLVSRNLFNYYFQPIVSASTGEICAYEALMRTDKSIGLSPLEILDIAKKYNRLYDVEKATLFNVLDYINNNQHLFSGRRVFINTIPGCFLEESDYSLLKTKYGHLFKDVTIELTEQNETQDAELSNIRTLEFENSTCQIAIDDYGTGYSNIVNLLRYQPNIIKIDRYLITDVDKDTNKQHFITSTVEFARENNIKVLAEGVETKEELGKVIQLGVDLVQGFLTARPNPDIITEIGGDIKKFIVEESLRNSSDDVIVGNNTLIARDGQVIILGKLAEENYSAIEVGGGHVTIVCDDEAFYEIPVTTTDNSHCQITLENVRIGADGPAITIGHGSHTEITLVGENLLNYQGIHVHKDASVTLNGEGNLYINTTENNGVGLGSFPENYYGDIIIDIGGELNITSQGANPVCIGGLSNSKKGIDIRRGTLNLEAKGFQSVCIGSTNGESHISIAENVVIDAEIVGSRAVAIGAIRGNAFVSSKGKLNLGITGETGVGIGVVEAGMGLCQINDGSVNCTLHNSKGVAIGSIDGDLSIIVSGGIINTYCEGYFICAIGNHSGSGNVEITGGNIQGRINSANGRVVGGINDRVIISGGNFSLKSVNDASVINAVNPFGQKLRKFLPTGQSYTQTFVNSENPDESYTYTANKVDIREELCVYIP